MARLGEPEQGLPRHHPSRTPAHPATPRPKLLYRDLRERGEAPRDTFFQAPLWPS